MLSRTCWRHSARVSLLDSSAGVDWDEMSCEGGVSVMLNVDAGTDVEGRRLVAEVERDGWRWARGRRNSNYFIIVTQIILRNADFQR